MFDCGANTNENKQSIRRLGYNYLTLRQKNVGTYKRHVRLFNEQLEAGKTSEFAMGERHYFHCAKTKDKGNEFLYVFSICPKLCVKDQLRKKAQKLEREKAKGNRMLRARKHAVLPSDKGWVTLVPSLQRTLSEPENPFISGIEGFFVLEGSVDSDPETILKLYKQRDVVEKFI